MIMNLKVLNKDDLLYESEDLFDTTFFMDMPFDHNTYNAETDPETYANIKGRLTIKARLASQSSVAALQELYEHLHQLLVSENDYALKFFVRNGENKESGYTFIGTVITSIVDFNGHLVINDSADFHYTISFNFA